MTDNPKDPSYITPAQEYYFNFDDTLTFVTGSPANVVSATWGHLNIQSFLTNSLYEDQNKIFFALMNMYQEFRWDYVHFDYVPTFSGTDQAAYVAAVNDVVGGTYDPEQAFAYAYAIANLNTSVVTYVPEHDDRIVRSTLNEYMMARAHPKAITHRLNSPYSWTYSPYTLDTILSPDSTNSPNAHSNVVVNPGNQASAMGNLNSSLPMKVPYISTKIYYKTPSGNNLQFNITDNWFAYKRYVYTPDNTFTLPNGSVEVTSGTRHVTLKFSFRNPDYRAWITNPTFTLQEYMFEDALGRIAQDSNKRYIKHLPTEIEIVKEASFITENDETARRLNELPVKRQRVDPDPEEEETPLRTTEEEQKELPESH